MGGGPAPPQPLQITYPYYMYYQPPTIVQTTQDNETPTGGDGGIDNQTWLVIGVVAIGALIIGVLMGRN